MRLDKVDAKIVLTILFLEKDITSTQLAKMIYNPSSRRELQDKDANLRKRLNKLVRYGILKKVKNHNGYWCYTVEDGSVLLGFMGKEDQFVLFRLP